MILEKGYCRLKDTRHGYMLYNSNDQYVGRSLDLYGEYCQLEVLFFERAIKPGDTVIDIGANIGAHTLVFSQLVGKTGWVLAMEPHRIHFHGLCANLALNCIHNTKAVNIGVSDRNCVMRLTPLDMNEETFSKPDNYGNIRLGQWPEGEPVIVKKLDHLGLHKCDFIKADVEGMELEILRGAVETIKKLQPILYVEADQDETARNAVGVFMDTLGYNVYVHDTPLFNPNNYFHHSEDVFIKPDGRPEHAYNFIGIHKENDFNKSMCDIVEEGHIERAKHT